MPRAAFHSLSPSASLAAYVASYIGLEWATFSPEISAFGITPWNPSAGLALGMVLLKGIRYAPLLALSPLLGTLLIRHTSLPWWIVPIEAAMIGAGYAAALAVLLRPGLGFDPTLRSLSDLLLLATATIVSAAAVAVAYVGVLVLAGLLPAEDFFTSMLRHFVGDVIGIWVVTPFMLILLSHERFVRIDAEAALQAVAIVLAILIVLGFGVRYQQQLFYVLFLPIVWVAVRRGLEGVTAALLIMQVGIMAALHAGTHAAIDVTGFQAVMLVLVFAGLAIGVLTSERERTERRLRRQQDELARAARIGSMGSLSTTVAHEVNQPLTAISNYARVALRAIDRGPDGAADAKEAISHVVSQVDRANSVIKRVREFITVGRTDPAPHNVSRIVNETLELLAPEIEAAAIAVEVGIPRNLPLVSVDLIQIEQVLTNILKNAIEAMSDPEQATRRISVKAARSGPSQIEIAVSDTGPGLAADFRLESLTPSVTTKPAGLGIGLVLSRSIVEAHGGKLKVENTGNGARASFTMPIAEGVPNDRGR